MTRALLIGSWFDLIWPLVVATQQFAYNCPGSVPAGQLKERESQSNPLLNGLIQYTFKINFVFVETFPVIP